MAIVDIDDYERVSMFRWSASTRGDKSYVRRSIRINGKGTTISLHRFILGLSREDALLVDHRNGNPLDNRKSNLRPATSEQNMANTRCNRKNNKVGFKGVIKTAGSSKWAARITCNGEYYQQGGFESPELAAMAYDEMAIRLHGEFASLNFKREKGD